MDRPGVAILIPVLNRPLRIAPLIENVRQTTRPPYRLLFIASESDTDELAELKRCRADFLIVPDSRISWSCKINDGFRATTEPWILTGADDLRFHLDWFERALRWAEENTCVIGTNDICNARVMTGEHSTHTLLKRDYIMSFGVIDNPGLVAHEGYRHDHADDELIGTAMARRVYVHAFDSIVEHMHPNVGKSQDDATYQMGRKFSSDGKRILNQRRKLWADERAVRAMMRPPPERAVVVTATYGDYDPFIRVPVEQTIPTKFICITDNRDLEVPFPWKAVYRKALFSDNPRMSAKVPKMMPDVGCDDVIWIDASHEITSATFVHEALVSREDGIAAFRHPRRTCIYKEIQALLGPENQGGLYFSRPLLQQKKAYMAERYPRNAGLFACGTLAWDLRYEKAHELGKAWFEETLKWSHQDQVEFPVVCRRLGIKPGVFPIGQLDPQQSRGQPFLANRWFRIHKHVKPAVVKG